MICAEHQLPLIYVASLLCSRCPRHIMSGKIALLRQCLNGSVMRSPVCRPFKAQMCSSVELHVLSDVGVLIARSLAVECGHGGLCVHCADALWNAGPASRHCP